MSTCKLRGFTCCPDEKSGVAIIDVAPGDRKGVEPRPGNRTTARKLEIEDLAFRRNIEHLSWFGALYLQGVVVYRPFVTHPMKRVTNLYVSTDRR